MARHRSNNGNSKPAPRYTLEERRAVMEEGVWHSLPSGVDVLLRPVDPISLLRGGRVPDILTPIVMDALYEPRKTQEALDEFVKTPRTQQEETLQMLAAIDVVCEAALVDASQLPFLSFADRGMIFRLAFLPAEVLSRFRAKQVGTVERVHNGDQVPQAA